ncbi:MAG: rhodanese-like domain-containing protein, partial [cyanobacterium endosymbiont of Rhopalodia yunnanensis]
LKDLIDYSKDTFVLIDVRNVNEYEISKIPGSILVPLPDIEDGKGVEKICRLSQNKKIIAHCKTGGRSAKALGILREKGILGTNVKGGITAWSKEVDPDVPQY